MIELAFNERQTPRPDPKSEQDSADHDLNYLLSYLAKSRGESYELLERPDELRRNTAAPDYLLREKTSGRSLLIERTQLMREDIQAAKAHLIKSGAEAILYGPMQISPAEITKHLLLVIHRKISRGQLLALPVDERILLIRNRLLATMRSFLRASFSFKDVDKHSVDHAFLIASSRLAKLW